MVNVARRLLQLALLAAMLGLTLPSPARAASGDRLWTAEYNSSRNHFDNAEAEAVSPDGSRLFVTGDLSHHFAYGTVAYDAATGAQLWVDRLRAVYPTSATPTAVAVGPLGGRVYVTGELGNGSNEDYGTVAYDAASGTRLWIDRYDGPAGGDDRATGLVVAPNGHTLYVTGESAALRGLSATTIAYDAKTGARLWVSRVRVGAHENAALALAISPDGSRLFATGQTGTLARPDIMTIALDASGGREVWSARFAGSAGRADFGDTIGVTPDGSTVIVAGSDQGATLGTDMVTLAYDAATGDRDWVATQDEGRYDGATDLAISPAGDTVVVTGDLTPGDNFDYGTVAYRTDTGAMLWRRLYRGPGDGQDFGRAVAFNPDGETVYVTGGSDDATGAQSFATVAYSATGGVVWVRRTTGIGPDPFDQANAVAVAPDGSIVFVTGLRFTNAINGDFYTIAYRA
jgi:WD40 repeat protein